MSQEKPVQCRARRARGIAGGPLHHTEAQGSRTANERRSGNRDRLPEYLFARYVKIKEERGDIA